MIWIAAGKKLPDRLLTHTHIDSSNAEKKYKYGLLTPSGMC